MDKGHKVRAFGRWMTRRQLVAAIRHRKHVLNRSGSAYEAELAERQIEELGAALAKLDWLEERDS